MTAHMRRTRFMASLRLRRDCLWYGRGPRGRSRGEEQVESVGYGASGEGQGAGKAWSDDANHAFRALSPSYGSQGCTVCTVLTGGARAGAKIG